MKTDFTKLMHAIEYKDNMNAYKESHALKPHEVLELFEAERAELYEALSKGNKESVLSEIADMCVFLGILYNKYNDHPNKNIHKGSNNE